MQESFLHFVWKYQKYTTSHLQCTDGSPLTLHTVGHHNHDAGPDFVQAQLMIGEVKWYGSIEIHVNASDWNNHKHHLDPNYNTVVLHVVWNADQECYREDGEQIPALELKHLISEQLLKRCNDLVNYPSAIPCETGFENVASIQKVAMLDHAAISRLNRKSDEILARHTANTGSWEETSYQLIARTFGFKKNAEAMLKLAEILPYKILLKHHANLIELEALMFGVAGFLDGPPQDAYHEDLQRHYDYLAKKYRLSANQMIRVEWKFLRMRPANFPTVRLAQLAQLFHKNSKFFQAIIHAEEVADLRSNFKIRHSDYWTKHYDFGKASSRDLNGMGAASLDVVLINVVVTLLAAYARDTGSDRYMERAVEVLQSLKPERNYIVTKWESLGMNPENAFDTQALIELKNEFCLKKKCLSCKIGLKLISG